MRAWVGRQTRVMRILRDSSILLCRRWHNSGGYGRSGVLPTIDADVEKMSEPVLTRSQDEVAECMAQGWQYPRIADWLGIAESTVRCHVLNIRAQTPKRGRCKPIPTRISLGRSPEMGQDA